VVVVVVVVVAAAAAAAAAMTTTTIIISRITKTQFGIIHAFDDSFDDKILE
jgi:hypothetical protein